MAVVQYGAIVDKMRGSIRGTTFSSAGGVEVAKGRPRPPRPQFAAQLAIKSLMASFAPAWRDLTGTDRTNWNNYSATVPFKNSLGQTYYIGGFQMFCRTSLFYSTRGVAVAVSAPGGVGAATASVATFDYNGGDVRIASFAPAFPGGMDMRGTVWYPTSQARKTPYGRMFTDFRYTGAALPSVVANQIDAAFPSGSKLRVFVSYRQGDSIQRLTFEALAYVDFTKP